jgi:succinate dehydrogenase/fumarate reductase flavoprotein subunit
MHKDVDDRSLAELAPSYEVAAAYLVHMLEGRFVNLNPFMQQMFLKLPDIENSEKKDFILETLRREFRDVAIEARKVFEHFNMLGSHVNVFGTTKEDIKVPIPCKLVGLREALEKNFDWIVPKNPF